jgi:hypothetical protein
MNYGCQETQGKLTDKVIVENFSNFEKEKEAFRMPNKQNQKRNILNTP